MGKSVVFLAQTRFSPTIEEQQAKCAAPGDEVILAGDLRFADLVKNNIRNSKTLRAGDRLKFYDLNSLIIAPGSLVRLLTRLLRIGVTIEICSEDLVIQPDGSDPIFHCLTLLDNQQRALHTIRTHGPDVKAGRKRALKDSQWPEIKALLAERQNSLAKVAEQYGVGRTTLFHFTKRMSLHEQSAE